MKICSFIFVLTRKKQHSFLITEILNQRTYKNHFRLFKWGKLTFLNCIMTKQRVKNLSQEILNHNESNKLRSAT